MGRAYAGVLGPTAYLTVLIRGMIRGNDASSILFMACVCLFVFAAGGYVVGRLASWIVTDSVKSQFDVELGTHGKPQDAANHSAAG